MNGEYRWVTYTVTPTDDGFYIHGAEIDVAGPFNSEAAAHAAARKIIDEMLDEPFWDPPAFTAAFVMFCVALLAAVIISAKSILGG
jgi:hypothetical protein